MNTSFARILAELSDAGRTEDDGGIRHEHSPFHLATLADCYSPDSIDSPGAQFLARVARDVADVISYEQSENGDDYQAAVDRLREDDAHEIADSAVPVYTHERWQVFVDLAAYNEDPSEFGATTDDLTGAAGVALYMIAERLVTALAGELSDALDEDAEDDSDVPA